MSASNAAPRKRAPATPSIVPVPERPDSGMRRQTAEDILRIQRDLSVLLGPCADVETALMLILDAALQLDCVDSGGVYVVTDDGGLGLVAHRGLGPEFVERSRSFDNDAPQTVLAKMGKVVFAPYWDVRPTLRSNMDMEGLRSIAVIPVVHRGELFTVMNLGSHSADHMPAQTREALEIMAQEVGATLLRLQAAAEVLQSRHDLQLLFDSIEDFLFVLDERGHILAANAVAIRRLGYPEAELMGQDVLMVHPPDRRREAGEIIAAMLRGERDACPVPLQTKAGTLIPVETRVTSGEWRGRPALFGVSRDVAARDEAERELRRLNRSLERRTSELSRAIDALTEANETKTRFLRSMSHELRTPLNSIIGFSALLADGVPGPVNEEQARQLGMIRNSGHHLLALINQVLDLSRIEAGQVDIVDERIDVAHMVRDLVALVVPAARARDLTMTVDIQDPAPELDSDPTKVRQIVLNLLSNAVKFTDGGTVTTTVSSAAPGSVVVSVTDAGPGIPPEELDLIFEEFERVGLPDDGAEGTGLGLAISRGLAESLGGTLDVRSAVGAGSTFTLTLPSSPTVATV